MLQRTQKGHWGDWRYSGNLLEPNQKWPEGWVDPGLESFWGTCSAICLPLVQTLLELWDIPPGPHSLSLSRLLFLLHTLPPGPPLPGRQALFLMSHGCAWSQLGPERLHSH